MVFKGRPQTFDTDERKINYALSFLKDLALEWFETYLLEAPTGNPPVFLTNYAKLQEELRLNFRLFNPQSSAEHELEQLQMSDNQHIAKYITWFTCLATQVR